MLAATERPLYQRIVEAAFSGGDDFCDISEGWSQSEVIEAECRNDDAIQERVVGHATASAVLEALFPPANAAADETIVRLLERERSAEGGRCCWASPRQDLLRVLLARADGVRFILPGRLRDGADRDEVEDLWRAALQDLERAERLLDPPHEPQRFKRVAQRWLRLWELANQFGEEDGRPNPAASDSRRRYATYLRRMLANLDAIATGADAGS